MKNDPLNKIAETLLGAKSVDILTHENMDGDAIGSSVALCLALKKEGIQKVFGLVFKDNEAAKIPLIVTFHGSACSE